MTPSTAAQSLLASLALPAGAASVWPLSRGGLPALVVKLDKRYWDRRSKIPASYEGYVVIVEPSVSLSAQRSFSKPDLAEHYSAYKCL